MSQNAKVLARALKDEATNSLDAWAERMADDSHATYVAVVWYDIDEVGEKTKTGDRVPKLVMVRNEVLGTTKDAPQPVIDAALAAMEARTGKTPLDFDQTTVVEGRPASRVADDDTDAEQDDDRPADWELEILAERERLAAGIHANADAQRWGDA